MKRAVVMVALACLASAGAFAACMEPPPAPAPPDGASASREDMLVAHRAFKNYDVTVRKYAACLQESGGSSLLQDTAMTRLQVAAEKFNAELRAFKKRGTG